MLDGVEIELSQYVNIKSVTLGVHTDGLIYLFVNDKPVGAGVDVNNSDVSGNVDSENVITLKGNLADGMYTLNYVDAEGKTMEIGQLKVGAVYANLFDPSTATLNARWSNSSYTFKTENGYVASDYIPVHMEEDTLMHLRSGSFSGNAGVIFYDSDKQILRSSTETATTGVGLTPTTATIGTDKNGDTTVNLSKKNNTLDTNFMSAAYIRVCLWVKSTAIAISDVSDITLTVDELIGD